VKCYWQRPRALKL